MAVFHPNMPKKFRSFSGIELAGRFTLIQNPDIPSGTLADWHHRNARVPNSETPPPKSLEKFFTASTADSGTKTPFKTGTESEIMQYLKYESQDGWFFEGMPIIVKTDSKTYYFYQGIRFDDFEKFYRAVLINSERAYLSRDQNQWLFYDRFYECERRFETKEHALDYIASLYNGHGLPGQMWRVSKSDWALRTENGTIAHFKSRGHARERQALTGYGWWQNSEGIYCYRDRKSDAVLTYDAPHDFLTYLTHRDQTADAVESMAGTSHWSTFPAGAKALFLLLVADSFIACAAQNFNLKIEFTPSLSFIIQSPQKAKKIGKEVLDGFNAARQHYPPKCRVFEHFTEHSHIEIWPKDQYNLVQGLSADAPLAAEAFFHPDEKQPYITLPETAFSFTNEKLIIAALETSLAHEIFHHTQDRINQAAAPQFNIAPYSTVSSQQKFEQTWGQCIAAIYQIYNQCAETETDQSQQSSRIIRNLQELADTMTVYAKSMNESAFKAAWLPRAAQNQPNKKIYLRLKGNAAPQTVTLKFQDRNLKLRWVITQFFAKINYFETTLGTSREAKERHTLNGERAALFRGEFPYGIQKKLCPELTDLLDQRVINTDRAPQPHDVDEL